MMHFNKIRFKGGSAIIDALSKNNTIETFDISFNTLGGGHNEFQIANSMKNMFFENKGVMHMDISYCGLTAEEIEIINEGLNQNHTIYGLHSVGNEAKVDQLGFLTKLEPGDDNVSLIYARITCKN